MKRDLQGLSNVVLTLQRTIVRSIQAIPGLNDPNALSRPVEETVISDWPDARPGGLTSLRSILPFKEQLMSCQYSRLFIWFETAPLAISLWNARRKFGTTSQDDPRRQGVQKKFVDHFLLGEA